MPDMTVEKTLSAKPTSKMPHKNISLTQQKSFGSPLDWTSLSEHIFLREALSSHFEYDYAMSIY